MTNEGILAPASVRLGLASMTKADAIRLCGQVLVEAGAATPEYIDGMFAREEQVSTYLGEGVAIPIRVAFDTLDEDKRPASADPSFSELWRGSGGEEDAVMRTVQRWRSQGR